MERRSFLQLLAVAAMGPSLPAIALMPEHKNQTLLRMMDECLAVPFNNPYPWILQRQNALLYQKFDEMLMFINENYSKPSLTEEEIAHAKIIMITRKQDITAEQVNKFSSNVLETVFPLAVVKAVIIHKPIVTVYSENFRLFYESYSRLILSIQLN